MEYLPQVVGFLIFVAVVAYLMWASQQTGRTVTLTQIVEVADVIRAAVSEADKFYNKSDGEKYDYVANQVSILAKDRGYNLPPEFVRQLIEGAVDIVHKARDRSDIPDHK